MFKKLFSNTLYVQIWENRIKAKALESGQIFDEQPLVAIANTESGAKAIVALGNAALTAKTPELAENTKESAPSLFNKLESQKFPLT